MTLNDIRNLEGLMGIRVVADEEQDPVLRDVVILSPEQVRYLVSGELEERIKCEEACASELILFPGDLVLTSRESWEMPGLGNRPAVLSGTGTCLSGTGCCVERADSDRNESGNPEDRGEPDVLTENPDREQSGKKSEGSRETGECPENTDREQSGKESEGSRETGECPENTDPEQSGKEPRRLPEIAGIVVNGAQGRSSASAPLAAQRFCAEKGIPLLCLPCDQPLLKWYQSLYSLISPDNSLTVRFYNTILDCLRAIRQDIRLEDPLQGLMQFWQTLTGAEDPVVIAEDGTRVTAPCPGPGTGTNGETVGEREYHPEDETGEREHHPEDETGEREHHPEDEVRERGYHPEDEVRERGYHPGDVVDSENMEIIGNLIIRGLPQKVCFRTGISADRADYLFAAAADLILPYLEAELEYHFLRREENNI